MIISCWLGADVWTGTCCERDVSAHSQCWVLEEGQQTVHYHLRITFYLIGIRHDTEEIGSAAFRSLKIHIFIQIWIERK